LLFLLLECGWIDGKGNSSKGEAAAIAGMGEADF